MEAALVFNKPSEELVDFFRVAACFLADFALKGPFLVFLARLFLNTFPVPFFFKGLDFFDRATCFFDFCIFTGILAAFVVLLLARLFFSGDWTCRQRRGRCLRKAWWSSPSLLFRELLI